MNEQEYTPTNYTSVIKSLETKYAKEGLKFSIPFSGSCPVQAYGEVRGMRFYFRFRHDAGSIKLGLYNQKAEDTYYEQQEKFRANRLAVSEKEYAAGNITKQDFDMSILFDSKTIKVLAASEDYYPNPVLIEVNVYDYTGEPFEGFLTAENAENLFDKLMEQL